MYDMNDRAAAIRRIQQYLYTISREYQYLPAVFVDGIYGEETRKGVADFQRNFNLAVTGRVNYVTFVALLAEYRRINEWYASQPH